MKFYIYDLKKDTSFCYFLDAVLAQAMRNELDKTWPDRFAVETDISISQAA